MTVNKLKYALITLMIMLYIILMPLAFNNILKPAYYSYIANCIPQGQTIIEAAGYTSGGTVTVSENNTLTMNIIVQNDKVLRHEYVHVLQFNQNRLPSCKIPILNYISEVEAYTLQWIPIPIV